MVQGYNHNIRHEGVIYHVQTEDSGPVKPLIITHLFVGGNIIATKKTNYEAYLGEPDCDERVRRQMMLQHKQMLRAISTGQIDNIQRGGVLAPATNSDLPPVPTTKGIEKSKKEAKKPPMTGKQIPAGHVQPPARRKPVPAPKESRPPKTPADSNTGLFADADGDKSLDEIILGFLADEDDSKK